MIISFKGYIKVWKSKTQTPKGWTVHTARCTIIPGKQNVCFVSYQGALLKQASTKGIHVK